MSEYDPSTTLEEVNRTYVKLALKYFNHNVTKASKSLGIGRATLYRYMKLWSLEAAPEVPDGEDYSV